jgi:hypothetical protein
MEGIQLGDTGKVEGVRKTNVCKVDEFGVLVAGRRELEAGCVGDGSGTSNQNWMKNWRRVGMSARSN